VPRRSLFDGGLGCKRLSYNLPARSRKANLGSDAGQYARQRQGRARNRTGFDIMNKIRSLSPQYRDGAPDVPREPSALSVDHKADAASFLEWRASKLRSIDNATNQWNDAVACAVEHVGSMDGVVSRLEGPKWHGKVASALRDMDQPMHSDVILSSIDPCLSNRLLQGRLRAFGLATLPSNPEFMPTKQRPWPAFPYFTVEPGTLPELSKEGLLLFANPPLAEADELDETGSRIDRHSYGSSPMISVELDLEPLPQSCKGAILLNWSFRGRLGAMAKIFLNGVQDMPAFEVVSTDEDRTPNFWTVLPWYSGRNVVDLKHVGSGYLWFEHVDVHHVIWNAT
jgi:hypothetical protein